MLQEKIDFLSRLKIFEGLTERELVSLARICDTFKYQKGSVIAYQNDIADRFYIIKSGRLDAFEMKNGVVAKSRRYMPYDYFDEIWLLERGVHPAMIRGGADGELFTIREDEFFLFLQDYPNAELDMAESTWAEVDRGQAAPPQRQYQKVRLAPGEFIEFESRRTGLLLILLLILPVLATILLPVIGVTVLVFLGITRLLWVSLTIFVLGIAPFGWTIYRYFDWANDYLLITNKHLVHNEFNLKTLQGLITKIPLDQVQSVKVLRPNFLETFLGIGTVQVNTASRRQGITFDKIRAPQQIEKTLGKIRQRERQLDASRERQAVRNLLERHFSVPDQLEAVREETPQSEAETAERQQRRRQSRRLRRMGARVEVDGSIIYGRHWFVLASRIWLASMVLIILLILLSLGMIYLVDFRNAFLGAIAVVIVLGFAYLYYLYEDWANDIFQVTGDMVIDIDRGPFGLSESRKTAPLMNIQDVRALRPNFIATLVGYGDVEIDTAGASAELKFEDVANPNQVQTDIFLRRELMRERLRAREAASRRTEFTLMLDEYHQLTEQDKIPRRTAPLDLALGEELDEGES